VLVVHAVAVANRVDAIVVRSMSTEGGGIDEDPSTSSSELVFTPGPGTALSV
jgi:hypothetical protein